MANLGRYCKAYYLKDFFNFSGFPRTDSSQADNAGHNTVDRVANSVVYLQDDLSVTTGIARDEGLVFRGAGHEWETYCREVLAFAPPTWSMDGSASQPAQSDAGAAD